MPPACCLIVASSEARRFAFFASSLAALLSARPTLKKHRGRRRRDDRYALAIISEFTQAHTGSASNLSSTYDTVRPEQSVLSFARGRVVEGRIVRGCRQSFDDGSENRTLCSARTVGFSYQRRIDANQERISLMRDKPCSFEACGEYRFGHCRDAAEHGLIVA